MRYYKLADGSTPNLYEIRTAFPDIGIPAGADIEWLGYHLITETTRPAPNTNCKVVETIELVAGKYTTVYTQVALTAPEIAAAKKAKVPVEVTMRQARRALKNAGLLPTVNAMIAGMTGDAGEDARIEWEFSSTVLRNRGLVVNLGAALNLTELQLDDLFIAAAAID